MSAPREPRPLVDAEGVAGHEPPAPTPELATLRAAQDRDLAVEGIPMVLALVDATGASPPPPASADAAGPASADGARPASADGAALVAELTRLRAALAPTRRDGDLGVLAALFTAAAHTDGRRPR